MLKTYVAACLAAAVSTLAAQPIRSSPNTTSQKIDAYLQEAVTRMAIPGLTVAATRNDTIVYTGAFGVTSLTTRKPMKPYYDFHWASVSKTVVATAVMQLVEKGKIRLDEKLVTYVPYFKQASPEYKDITIRQMLNHTSGIGDVDDYEWDKPQYDEAAPERFVRSIAKDSLLFAPGTGWQYSNTAFEILGVVITRVSGMPFETYVQQNIFRPLGMTYSSFIYPDIADSLRVAGHVWTGKPEVSKVYPYNRIHAPSSTLNSSVLEMTHYAMANLHRGKYNGRQLLADSTYDVLWTNSVNIPDKPKVGASWFIDDYKGMKVVRHSGGDTGFRSFLLLVPEKNMSVLVACNYELVRTFEMAHAVLDLLLGEQPLPLRQQIGFSFTAVLEKEGIAKARDYYQKTKADSVKRSYFIWDEDDAALAYAGYLLMDAGKMKEAITVFKFNCEVFPNSGYAYGHLAEAYVRANDKQAAIESFKKAITLAPGEDDFKKQLRKLTAKKGK